MFASSQESRSVTSVPPVLYVVRRFRDIVPAVEMSSALGVYLFRIHNDLVRGKP